MGKKNKQRGKRHENPEFYELPSSAFSNENGVSDEAEEEQPECEEISLDERSIRHDLYQRAVQSPKGEISYMQKFFLTYVGRRTPLHLREDFCGTALICSEWVRGDPRRTAVGVDLDEDALSWGVANNVQKIRGDASNRVHLFLQNVLHSLSKASKFTLKSEEDNEVVAGSDIVCALNFSCCCLQERKDLVSYFKRAFSSITNTGGVFVMDLYGGVSSEQPLRFRRRYNDFTYTWEQEAFDIIKRTTRISLHFQLNKRVIRHAFTYHWRLWTIPEICDCLNEAGFDSTHLWLCEMPDLHGRKELETHEQTVEYEEMSSFKQCDAWNAYVVGVKLPHN